MSDDPKHVWTPEAYLDFERTSETKHEYLRGEIFDMAGASYRHTLISMNASRELSTQLRKKPCTVHANDLRLQVRAARLYTYPDLVVICGEPRFTDTHEDMVSNPTILVEILSKSTENYDRGLKFKYYQTLETLKEYVLISRDLARIDRYTRQPNGDWLISSVTGLDETVELTSIDCTLALRDIYEKVDFEAEEAEPGQ